MQYLDDVQGDDTVFGIVFYQRFRNRDDLLEDPMKN